MNINQSLCGLISNFFKEIKLHPFFCPYLNSSHDDPPTHYLHQWEILSSLALRNPIRILIADEIGLGKTVTAILLSKYLQNTGRAKKIIIIVPKVLIFQWHKELIRLGIPPSMIRRLESSTIPFYKSQQFPQGYYLASMDLLKREERLADIINVDWDLIIVDEVHKFGLKTQRFLKIGKNLIEAHPQRNVIFLSATPHRGDPKDYIWRLKLLDPYLIPNWMKLDRKLFYESTHGSLIFRRTKEDINNIYEEKKIFVDANFYAILLPSREEEKVFIQNLIEFLRSKLAELANRHDLISEKVIPLLLIIIFKRAISSPYAAWTTLQRLLLKRIEKDFSDELISKVESFFEAGFDDFEVGQDPDASFNEFIETTSQLLTPGDIEKIKKLYDSCKVIMEKGDTKLEATICLIDDIMKESNDKIIIFTEYKDTLEYIEKNIAEKHPEWCNNIVTLSSDQARDEVTFNRLKNEFEKSALKRILIATDVIAEGINLQAANILINYEIPWSLLKLEQRIGRIWRLGQKKDVEIYTFFTDNIIDQAALNSIYQKLINLKKADLKPRPITGQEIFYYTETKGLSDFPPSVSISSEKKKRKFIKITETQSIRTYLEKNEEGLKELVRSILEAKAELEKELSQKGVLYGPKSKDKIQETIKCTGFKHYSEMFEALKDLLKTSAGLLGIRYEEENGSIKIIKEGHMPVNIYTLDDFFALFSQNYFISPDIALVAKNQKERRISIIPILIKDKRQNILLYKDIIGLDIDQNEIIRGAMLLKTLAQVLRNFVGFEKIEQKLKELSPLGYAVIIENMKTLTLSLNSLEDYISKLEREKLRKKDDHWIKKHEINVDPLDPIGFIHFVKISPGYNLFVSEEKRKEIEKKAIEYVLEYEKKEGRFPSFVGSTEHYDIKSINLEKEEIRLIEVKGHAGDEIYAELTESEADLAKKEKDRYWLYIVYNIYCGQPRLLLFQNPLETMSVSITEKIEKRFILTPKD